MNRPIPPETVTFEREIAVPVARVFQMFVNRDDASDWLGDDAHIRADAENGYAIYIRRNGDHAYGAFTEYEENKTLAMQWHTGADSEVSFLEVCFEAPTEDSTRLILTHTDLKDEDTVRHYTDYWKTRLDHLKRQLESGERAEIADRIIIGIMPGNLDEAAIERLNLPVKEGVLVADMVTGYSAEAAGIQRDDVIVEVNEKPVKYEGDGVTIFNAVQDLKPGDEVNVKYYRGTDLYSVDVTLKGYPIPDIPSGYGELADWWAKTYQDIYDLMLDVTADVPEDLAAAKPDEDTYSVKESIARLILRQSHTLEWLSTYIEGPRRINPYTNHAARIKSLVTVYPTLADLITEFRRKQQQTLVILRDFPESLARPDYYWWIAFEAGYLPIVMRNQLHEVRDRLSATASPSA